MSDNIKLVTVDEQPKPPFDPANIEEVKDYAERMAREFMASFKNTAEKYWHWGAALAYIQDDYADKNKAIRIRKDKMNFTLYLNSAAKKAGCSVSTAKNAIAVARKFPTATAASGHSVTEAIAKTDAKGIGYIHDEPSDTKTKPKGKPKSKDKPEGESKDKPEDKPEDKPGAPPGAATAPTASITDPIEDINQAVMLLMAKIKSIKSRKGVRLTQLEDALTYLKSLPE